MSTPAHPAAAGAAAPRPVFSHLEREVRPHLAGIDEDVEGFLAEVDRRLVPHLRRAQKRLPRVQPLRSGTIYQMTTGGKRIRAALCVGACELVGGDRMAALDFAAAVEHMQNFTLIHDDIADGDTQRRGQDAVWTRYGVGHGVNIGDLFVPLAALAILDAEYTDGVKVALMRVLAEFGMQMAEGQAMDLNLRRSDTPTAAEYLACTRRKTGAFLAMATVGGATIGGAGGEHLQALSEFAMLAGTAFQIKDDILDVDGQKGRDTGSDVLEGKRTLLVIHAAGRVPEADRRRLFQILNRDRARNTPQEVRWVCDLYRACGALDAAQATAKGLLDQATALLGRFPETEAKYRFLRISTYLGRRMR